MRKILKGFLVFVVICGLIGVFIGYFIGTLPVLSLGAKAFLMAVSKDQYEQAYTMCTPGFQARNDLESFKANVKMTGLDQYKDAEWVQTKTYPNQEGGMVLGRVFTKNNQIILVEFQFSLIQGKQWNEKAWLINNIRFPKNITPSGTPEY